MICCIFRKLTLIAFAAVFSSAFLSGQTVTLKSDDLAVRIGPGGRFESVKVLDQEILRDGGSPVLIACSEGKLIYPSKVVRQKGMMHFTMSDGNSVDLKSEELANSISLETVKVPENYDAVIFGPIGLNINETVGEVIGVAQGNGVAFGMQGLNIKTVPGVPQEYSDTVKNAFYGDEGRVSELTTGRIPANRQAAVSISGGSVLQMCCRNRTRVEKRTVNGLENMMVLPVKGPDALMTGAKVALFGSASSKALDRIGKVELERGLPHPMFDGEWGKTARSAMRSYLISYFSEKDFDFILDKAETGGFKYVYHSGPFKTWGCFQWSEDFVKGGDAGVKALVDKAAARGIALGVHCLSNFTTTNDPYVTPVPSDHLLKQGRLYLMSDIDAVQKDLLIRKSTYFSVPVTLNAMIIDKEIITFGSVEEIGGNMVLSGCRRGAFGTAAAAHLAKSPLYKLWDYPYRTLFPDLELQDRYSDRLSEIFNKTGLRQISFDGLEGTMYTGQDDYAPARFVSRWYEALDHNVVNDGSNLDHYNWHINTRMNWGEPWGEAMRTGQVEGRIRNQEYFRRNLFPRMLGWFLIRLSDKNMECSTLEDTEWALSEAAGFDAGYAMVIDLNTLKHHGQIDSLLGAIKNWDLLREKQCFTEEQMAKLRDPKTEWHLEKQGEGSYLLYPLNISSRFTCNLGEMQPGQPGGADWSVDNPYAGVFSVRLKVTDGSVSDPKFMTDLGTAVFPCTVEENQYLLVGCDGKAEITDLDFNVIKEVKMQGAAKLPEGFSHIAFSCGRNSGTPVVDVRFITRGKPETVKCSSR